MGFNNTAGLTKYLRFRDFAREWGISTQRVRNHIRGGKLPAKRVGVLLLIEKDAATSVMEGATVPPTTQVSAA